MAKKVKLFCEAGQHTWMRESQRGKRPKNCPKHKPELVIDNKPKSKTKRLYCEHGDHHWLWPRRGGFEPKNCPEHKPVKSASETEYVDLYCENGKHTWSRQRQRGKRPVNCPLHSNSTKTTGGLGALKRRSQPKVNGKEPILKGLGKIKAKRRKGLRNLQSRYAARRKEQAQEAIDTAVQRYEEAMEEERELFLKLDRLENMKLKNPKTLAKIDALRDEHQRKIRKLNNMYSGAHHTIASHRKIINA